LVLRVPEKTCQISVARAIELRYNQIWRSADRLSSSTVSACLLGLLKRARAIVRRWSSNVPEH